MKLVAVALALTGWLALQPADDVVRGTWIASAGPGLSLTGQWSAQPHPEVPNAVYGSWTIVSDANRIVAQGTWSADKSARGWRGSWSARTSSNRVYSGEWEASTADLEGDSLLEMLRQTAAKQVAGSWMYGRLSGHWWLQRATR